MIEFFLSPGHVSDENQLFEDIGLQRHVQLGLLIAAMTMVPVMFLAVPLLEHYSPKHLHQDIHDGLNLQVKNTFFHHLVLLYR